MIRVLLADDHPVVRAGLRGMLAAEADIEVAGEAASGPEAVARARTGGFDVILMDLRMPGGDGVTATEHILAADPDARVLILTTYETDADILRLYEMWMKTGSPRARGLLRELGVQPVAAAGARREH